VALNDAPIVAAQTLLRHDLADDWIIGYLSRTWALDDRHCYAALETARFLIQQETTTRERVNSR
jgi:hypothetical protein